MEYLKQDKTTDETSLRIYHVSCRPSLLHASRGPVPNGTGTGTPPILRKCPPEPPLRRSLILTWHVERDVVLCSSTTSTSTSTRRVALANQLMRASAASHGSSRTRSCLALLSYAVTTNSAKRPGNHDPHTFLHHFPLQQQTTCNASFPNLDLDLSAITRVPQFLHTPDYARILHPSTTFA